MSSTATPPVHKPTTTVATAALALMQSTNTKRLTQVALMAIATAGAAVLFTLTPVGGALLAGSALLALAVILISTTPKDASHIDKIVRMALIAATVAGAILLGTGLACIVYATIQFTLGWAMTGYISAGAASALLGTALLDQALKFKEEEKVEAYTQVFANYKKEKEPVDHFVRRDLLGLAPAGNIDLKLPLLSSPQLALRLQAKGKQREQATPFLSPSQRKKLQMTDPVSRNSSSVCAVETKTVS